MTAFTDAITATVSAHNAELAELQAFKDRTGIGLAYDWQSYKGYPLDLTGYVETFVDNFDTDSVMDASGFPAGGKWYSPARSDFENAGATFRRDAITVANSQCRIRCERISPPSPTSDWGVWKTGHMQTMDRQGNGFAQSMGYAEARMKFPQQLVPFGWVAKTGAPIVPQKPADSHGQRGAWPSFWDLSANEMPMHYDNNHLIEMDTTEDYGGDFNLHSAVHLKTRRVPQPNDPLKRQTNSELTDNKFIQWDGQFHTYGRMYDDNWLTIYFDGKSVIRYPMNEYLRVPKYLNISLALFKPHMNAVNAPFDLIIDSVRALSRA